MEICHTIPCNHYWCQANKKCILLEGREERLQVIEKNTVGARTFNQFIPEFKSPKTKKKRLPKGTSYPTYKFETYKSKCFYCDKKLNDSNRSQDHIFPKDKGGTLSRGNKVYACQDPCNTLKSDLTLLELVNRLNHLIKYATDGHEIAYYKKYKAKVIFMITKLYPELQEVKKEEKRAEIKRETENIQQDKEDQNYSAEIEKELFNLRLSLKFLEHGRYPYHEDGKKAIQEKIKQLKQK